MAECCLAAWVNVLSWDALDSTIFWVLITSLALAMWNTAFLLPLRRAARPRGRCG